MREQLKNPILKSSMSGSVEILGSLTMRNISRKSIYSSDLKRSQKRLDWTAIEFDSRKSDHLDTSLFLRTRMAISESDAPFDMRDCISESIAVNSASVFLYPLRVTDHPLPRALSRGFTSEGMS